MSRWAFVLGLAGCTPAPVAPVSAERPLFTIRDGSLGPLDAQTLATLSVLRKALAGYDVVALNHEGLEYRVSLGSMRLFDIVPDATNHILNVHVISPRIDIAGSPWRVGATFRDTERIDACECWADQVVCFKERAHVAIGLAKVCREGALESIAAKQALAGTPIRTAIWSPRPLIAGGYEAPD